MTKTIFDLTNPSLPLVEYDAIEVSPVAYLGHGNFEVTREPEKADFWSVYLHLETEGGVECIADLPTEQLAKQFGEVMRCTLRHARLVNNLSVNNLRGTL